MGYKVKLDTNGYDPAAISKLLDPVDYVAMDIKAPLQKYNSVTGLNGMNLENIKKSSKILIEGTIPYEFRTTVVPGLIDRDSIRSIAMLIEGAESWYLQRFRTDTELFDPAFRKLVPY